MTSKLKSGIGDLRTELKLTNYNQPVDEIEIAKGKPTSYLPIVHHVLLKYSKEVSSFIRLQGFDLHNLNDYVFIETTFKLMPQVFNYRPHLSVSQFFYEGFADKKIPLLLDLIKILRGKHTILVKAGFPQTISAVTGGIQQQLASKHPEIKSKYAVVNHERSMMHEYEASVSKVKAGEREVKLLKSVQMKNKGSRQPQPRQQKSETKAKQTQKRFTNIPTDPELEYELQRPESAPVIDSDSKKVLNFVDPDELVVVGQSIVLPSPQKPVEDGTVDQVTRQIKKMFLQVEELTNKFVEFESRTSQKLNNISAEMTIFKNKLEFIEAKKRENLIYTPKDTKQASESKYYIGKEIEDKYGRPLSPAEIRIMAGYSPSPSRELELRRITDEDKGIKAPMEYKATATFSKELEIGYDTFARSTFPEQATQSPIQDIYNSPKSLHSEIKENLVTNQNLNETEDFIRQIEARFKDTKQMLTDFDA